MRHGPAAHLRTRYHRRSTGGFMSKVAILCMALAAVGSAGCKKRGGGGGGGWLVGSEGLMVNVNERGELGEGYDLGATEQLNGIACRYIAEAWVVGNNGTLLYTSDGGESWEAQDLGTTAHLRTLATQDAGPVFVAGDGVFFTANPALQTGAAEWTQLRSEEHTSELQSRLHL